MTLSNKIKNLCEYAEKGHIPWNKGTKGRCKPSKTSFKKGNVPWNKGKPHYAIKGDKNPAKRLEVREKLRLIKFHYVKLVMHKQILIDKIG